MELKKTMRHIQATCRREEEVSIGTLVDALGSGGFGVLLFLPALIIVLPVSLIPGLSSFCALLVLFAAFHLFFGRDELWLPQRIRDISLSEEKTVRVVENVQNLVRKMDGFSRPRLYFLTEGIAEKAAIGAAVILSLATLVLGFIPMVDIVLMTPVIFFGFGICNSDGLMIGIGWAVLALSLGVAGLFI